MASLARLSTIFALAVLRVVANVLAAHRSTSTSSNPPSQCPASAENIDSPSPNKLQVQGCDVQWLRFFLLGGWGGGGAGGEELHVIFRRPTMEPSFVKTYRDFEASSFGILVFRGHEVRFDLIFGPVLTNSDLFCRAGLTYFRLFRPISPCGPNLFSPISTYFVSQ